MSSYKGEKVSTEEFVLIYQEQPLPFKLVPVITKKVVPKAVERNRIKRLIKEALKSKNNQSGQMILIVKKNIASLKAAVVERKIEELFKKIK